MLHEYDVHNHYNPDKYVNNGDKFLTTNAMSYL